MKEKVYKLITESPRSFTDLKNDLGIKGFKSSKNLDEVLKELRLENKIYFAKKANKYNLKDEEIFVGTYSSTRKDFGFVENETKTVFIPGKFTLNALSGDTVRIKVFPKFPDQKDDRRAGKIIRVLKRNGNNIIGRMSLKDGKLLFIPDEQEVKYTYEIETKLKLKDGDIIVGTFKDIIENVIYLTITQVLGNGDDPLLDWKIIAHKYNLNLDFSKLILKELEKLATKKSDPRVDLGNKMTVTIDGETSKDLDDAISVELLENNNFKLSVHIADVSFYVEKESKIDLEAYNRGTSVYLIDQVIPMLPQKLSNDLCSLNPDTRKLTMTCEMEIDQKGDLVDYKLYESEIVSNYRLTYTEVDTFIKNPKQTIKNNLELAKLLTNASKLAKILRVKKIKNGMIDFTLYELKINLDDKGAPIEIIPKYQTVAEKLIEDLMVVTNETVALAFGNKELPGIFRVHGKPKQEKLEYLSMILRTFGHSLDSPVELISSKAIANLIAEVEDKEYSDIIKRYTIQSMEKAKYHQFNEGHFALGLQNYLHFTSPIRRYPDLIVHRLIKEWLINDTLPTKQELISIIPVLEENAKDLSEKERVGMMVERKLSDVKKARFMKKEIGNKFSGIVISINSFGFFVELSNFTQGLVRLESMEDDEYYFDDIKLTISGKKNGKIFGMGKKVEIVVKDVDTIKGTVDLGVI